MEALPLRTGRTNCVTSMQRDMAEQTLAIIASMMQQAAHDATLYCAEAKRTVIMPRDIELALKRLVLPGSAYWTRDDLPEEARQIRQRLFVEWPDSHVEWLLAVRNSHTKFSYRWIFLSAGDKVSAYYALRQLSTSRGGRSVDRAPAI